MKKYVRLTNEFIKSSLKLSVLEKTIKTDHETHWHEFYEIELIISGKALYTINGKSYTVKKGDLFFITPIDFHSVKIDRANPPRLVNIMFDSKFIDEELMFQLIKNKINNIHLSETDYENVYCLCNLMKTENKNNYFYRLYMQKLLNCIIITILGKTGKPDKDLSSDTVFASQRASFFIQLNFQQQITLEEISDYVGLNKTYLSECFHRDIGITIKNYITNIRLDYASKMLMFSKNSVTDICFESGYNDFSSFSRAFKKRFGTSPRNYRNGTVRSRQ